MSEPKLRIELPTEERGVAPDVIRRFDRLRRKLERRDLRPAERRDAEDEMMRLMGASRAAAEHASLMASLGQTVRLAQARGEDITTGPVIRVDSRDGLRSLFEASHLTGNQYQDASDLRRCYEARSADVGSQLGQESSGGAHNNDLFVLNRRIRAERLTWLGKVERAIVVKASREPAALQMLRAVVGEGTALRAFGAGRTFYRHLEALRLALDIAHDVPKPPRPES